LAVSNLKVGDIVEWTSHGSHWNRKKRGKVVMVVAPGIPATAKIIINKISEQLGHKLDRCSLGYGPPRKQTSYLVIGEEKHKGMFKIFWPRVSSLRKVES
jgi:hypothetical protein